MPKFAVNRRMAFGASAPTGSLPLLETAASPSVSSASEKDARLRKMVDGYIDFVARVLKNAGTPDAEIDDDVQRTFITAAKRLDEIRLGAAKSFLLPIALRVAAHARRTAARRREVSSEEAPELVESVATPEQ